MEALLVYKCTEWKIAGLKERIMNQIIHAEVTDAAEILELQKLAYQSEAVIYDDWMIGLSRHYCTPS
jgi:hypothetical protein